MTINKVIYCCSSAPIAYSFGGMDVYDSFDAVASGRLAAPLAAEAETAILAQRWPFSPDVIRTIFCAPDGQTRVTAELLQSIGGMPNANIMPTEALHNINYQMTQLLPKKDFVALPYAQAIAIARRRFVEKLYDGLLTETLQQIECRIDRLRKQVAEVEAPAICIGHSFFLHILFCLQQDQNCAQDRERFIRAFDPDQKPFEPLGGFFIKL